MQYAAEMVNTKRAQALTKKARRLVSGWTPWDGCGVPIRSDSPVGTTALSPVGFVAPEKQPETLALLNPHPRDFAVRFVAAGHKYLIGGVPTRGSVTGMVHHFAQDFVEEEVIQAMQESAYWPRPSYLREDVLASELSVLATSRLFQVEGLIISLTVFITRPSLVIRSFRLPSLLFSSLSI